MVWMGWTTVNMLLWAVTTEEVGTLLGCLLSRVLGGSVRDEPVDDLVSALWLSNRWTHEIGPASTLECGAIEQRIGQGC